MQLPEHGANPHIVYEKLGIKIEDDVAGVIDFSENVNPAGLPKAVADMWPDLMTKLAVYPDPDAEPFLSAAAKFHHVDKSSVFVGNGAAELLALLAERYRGGKAIVVHPTFSEYEATLRAKSVEIIQVVASEKDGFKLPIDEVLSLMASASVLYLCTPNNPTGTMPTRCDLLGIIRRGAEVNCEIVLDEAFIDFIDESQSFICELTNNPHVIVVRSMTKMYAIPGIRLGYVVANPIVIKEVKALAPHWNVNGMAAHIGAVCLRQDDFRAQAIGHSAQQREEMTAFLLKHRCHVIDGAANFISFTPGICRDAQQLYRDMLGRGLVLRHSENFIGMDGKWLRIGMKKEAEMMRLKEELTQWFADN